MARIPVDPELISLVRPEQKGCRKEPCVDPTCHDGWGAYYWELVKTDEPGFGGEAWINDPCPICEGTGEMLIRIG